MFKYELIIDTEKMWVNIVPWFQPEIKGAGYRQINHFTEEHHTTFFWIKSELFPSYLRCEDFPWDRLKNLNEIYNFIIMYNQYNLWIKSEYINVPTPVKIGDPIDVYGQPWTTSSIQFYTSSTSFTVATSSILISPNIQIIPTEYVPFVDPFRNTTGYNPYARNLGPGLTCSCNCSEENKERVEKLNKGEFWGQSPNFYPKGLVVGDSKTYGVISCSCLCSNER